MATMNFSIPEDVKNAFNAAFDGDNKSAVVTELLRRAVDERERLKKRESLVEQMRKMHSMAEKRYSAEEIDRIRKEGRP